MKHKPQYRFAWKIIMASVCLVITAVLSSCDSKNHTSEKASGTYAEFEENKDRGSRTTEAAKEKITLALNPPSAPTKILNIA